MINRETGPLSLIELIYQAFLYAVIIVLRDARGMDRERLSIVIRHHVYLIMSAFLFVSVSVPVVLFYLVVAPLHGIDLIFETEAFQRVGEWIEPTLALLLFGALLATTYVWFAGMSADPLEKYDRRKAEARTFRRRLIRQRMLFGREGGKWDSELGWIEVRLESKRIQRYGLSGSASLE